MVARGLSFPILQHHTLPYLNPGLAFPIHHLIFLLG